MSALASFSERNIPPRDPAGPTIPRGARTAILAWFGGKGITPTTLWENLIRQETYARWDEIEADIRARFGDAHADGFGAEMADHWTRSRNRMAMVPGVNYDAEPALLAIPSALFLDVLEYALQSFGYQSVVDMGSVNEINRIFSKRGVSYQFSYSGRADWNGDPAAYQEIVKPALEVLIDPRLAGCRSEFHSAMEHLRKATSKDYEDAIEEAGKAVESVMKVLLDERQITRTGKEGANRLFEMLRENGVVEAEADNTVLGAARIRNQWGGHGAGAAPRHSPPDLSELAVRVTATAIVFLAGRLP